MRLTGGRRTPRVRRFARPLLAVLVVGGLLAALPAGADASRYLSRSQAAKATKRVARSITLATTATARCWPSGRRHTQRVLRFKWRIWDCGWNARVSHTDGSVEDCNGKLRITGKRGGSTPNTLRAKRCVQVTGPNPGPGPGPGPGPDPTGVTARQKQMIEQAVTYGIGYANELIAAPFSSGGFYYGQMNRPDCVFINVTKVRCPIYFWWESQDQALLRLQSPIQVAVQHLVQRPAGLPR